MSCGAAARGGEGAHGHESPALDAWSRCGGDASVDELAQLQLSAVPDASALANGRKLMANRRPAIAGSCAAVCFSVIPERTSACWQERGAVGSRRG
jgi:hypothetical protein